MKIKSDKIIIAILAANPLLDEKRPIHSHNRMIYCPREHASQKREYGSSSPPRGKEQPTRREETRIMDRTNIRNYRSQ